MKKIRGIVILLTLVATLLVACGGGNSNSGNNTSGGNTAQLSVDTFSVSSITIKKGESVTLVNSTGVLHIIANGSWHGNTLDPKAEAGAPTANNIQFSTQDQSQSIGPFNTTGTFHYYCSVHSGMNLTVIVQ